MKITFAGVGGAFAPQNQYQSNMLLTASDGKRLMIDCGGDARFSFGELGATNANISEWTDGVYISHLHADHIGGLEWIGFCSFFGPKKIRPKLFIVDSLIDDLWDSLKGGMRSVQGSSMRLTDFFDVQPVKINSSFKWGGVEFQPVQTVHIMDGMRIVPSYGLLFQDKKKVFLTTDTQFCPRQIETFYDKADLIFHDCETYPFKSGVHAHYDDLKTLPEATKKKMWLYHYSPEPTQEPVKDGFQGFVKKGQTFEI